RTQGHGVCLPGEAQDAQADQHCMSHYRTLALSLLGLGFHPSPPMKWHHDESSQREQLGCHPEKPVAVAFSGAQRRRRVSSRNSGFKLEHGSATPCVRSVLEGQLSEGKNRNGGRYANRTRALGTVKEVDLGDRVLNVGIALTCWRRSCHCRP